MRRLCYFVPKIRFASIPEWFWLSPNIEVAKIWIFKRTTRIRCCIYIFIFFVSSLLFARFFNLDLKIIAFLKVLFMCGLWFPLIHFLFFGALVQCEFKNLINTLSANRTKWSNTQTIRWLLPWVGVALKGLKSS